MVALSEDRGHRAQWERAAELLLEEVDVATFSAAVAVSYSMAPSFILRQLGDR
jgi:hypothetical protein